MQKLIMKEEERVKITMVFFLVIVNMLNSPKEMDLIYRSKIMHRHANK